MEKTKTVRQRLIILCAYDLWRICGIVKRNSVSGNGDILWSGKEKIVEYFVKSSGNVCFGFHLLWNCISTDFHKALHKAAEMKW